MRITGASVDGEYITVSLYYHHKQDDIYTTMDDDARLTRKQTEELVKALQEALEA